MEQKMGGEHRAGKEIAASSPPPPPPPPPLSESFVRAVWSLLRLSVDVHLKDGSVFSGIFLTVSPEKNIVLKKAKLTKRGRSRSNVASEDVVETLVIASGDIVKVVSESKKNVLSFADVAENSQKFGFSEQESPEEVQASNLSSETCLIPVKPIGVGEGNAEERCKLLHSGASCDATAVFKPPCFERRTSEDAFPDVVQSSVSTSSTHISDVTLESFGSSMMTTVEMDPPQNSESNKSSKEVNLNPEAKTFSPPSHANPILPGPSALPAVPHLAHQQIFSPMFVGAGNQRPAGFIPVVQYFQPYIAVPLQPGYAGQYHPAEAVPPVNDPNSQAEAMTRHRGQIVHMQPAIYGAARRPRRPSFIPHHIQHQGNVAGQASQLYVSQPYAPTGQQPFAVPSQAQTGQPPSSSPPTHPMPGPGSNRP